MTMKVPKHHYIPVFYLKKWGRADGRLIEFSKPFGNAVKPRRTHPDGTGYVRGLYRLPGVKDEVAELIESRFMWAVDDAASYAMLRLLDKKLNDWPADLRSAWSMFIISLHIRSPKSVGDVKFKMREGWPELWDRERQRLLKEDPSVPPLGDYDPTATDRSSLIALQRFINNPTVGQLINNMFWSLCDLSETRHRLLTSDRPVVMTNGIGTPNGHFAIALSPTLLFLATYTAETTQSIYRMKPKDTVSNYNTQVVRNAVKYVWGHDESQIRFIQKHMSADADKDRSFFGVPNIAAA